MNKKTKIVIPLAIVAIVAAVAAYLQSPVSKRADTTPKASLTESTAAKMSKAASNGEAVDIAVDAIIQGYDQDQAAVQQEDADASSVEKSSVKINPLSEVYNENNF
jgi:hypothetical protein